jgi:hypothetical protein
VGRPKQGVQVCRDRLDEIPVVKPMQERPTPTIVGCPPAHQRGPAECARSIAGDGPPVNACLTLRQAAQVSRPPLDTAPPSNWARARASRTLALLAAMIVPQSSQKTVYSTAIKGHQFRKLPTAFLTAHLASRNIAPAPSRKHPALIIMLVINRSPAKC